MPKAESVKTVTLKRRDGSGESGLAPIDLRFMARNGEVHPLDQIVCEQTGRVIAAWKIQGLFPKSFSDRLVEVYRLGLDASPVIREWEISHSRQSMRSEPSPAKARTIALEPEPESLPGWYVLDGGVVTGPFESDALAQLTRQGRITPSSNVSRSANGPWIVAGSCVPLMGLFAGTTKRSRRDGKGTWRSVLLATCVLVMAIILAAAIGTPIIRDITNAHSSIDRERERQEAQFEKTIDGLASGAPDELSAGDRIAVKQGIFAFESASALRHYLTQSQAQKMDTHLLGVAKPGAGPRLIRPSTEVTIIAIDDELAFVEWYGFSPTGMSTQMGWVLIEELKREQP